MKLLNFALIKITLCLILGILSAYYFDIPTKISLPAIAVLTFALLLVLLIEKKSLVKSPVFGIITFMLFFCLGILSFQLHDQKQFKNHYTQHFDPSKDSVSTITFKIREVLKPGAYHNKYIVHIQKIDTQVLEGKTLLNVQKDSLTNIFKVDDILVTGSQFKDLNPPLNPNQFDYKSYLQKQHIYHQIFSDEAHLLVVSSQTHTLLGYASKFRSIINTKLKSHHINGDELSLINALLLGQRQDISQEVYDSYSKAGAIHILAVSGLHVGIILLLLNWLFKPLEYLKHGKVLKIFLILGLLWAFAIVAGLSASVTRAVMMFSIVAIGMNLKRPSNIYNTLAISMFLLLLIKPMFLFDVGFQMSYLAVIAIVSIQPSLEQLFQPKFKPLKKIWQIFTVTLAAQLGVVPISLYYFHQFPGLFFVSNLVIIPVLGLILGVGILVIMLALLNLLPLWLAEIYSGLIGLMNSFVRWISLQEQFVFKDVSFSLLLVLTSYLLIITFFFVFKRQNYKRLVLAMTAVVVFQSALIFEKKSNSTQELIIFHKSRYSLIAFKNNTSLTLKHNLDSSRFDNDNTIRNYIIGNSIQKIAHDALENFYIFNHKKLLVVDSLSIYQLKKLPVDYVLLSNSPKVNLNRLIDSLKPALIIADGSNYKSYMKRWETTCKAQKIPFHFTSQKGAFVLRTD